MLLGGKRTWNHHVIYCPQIRYFSSGYKQINNSRGEAGKGWEIFTGRVTLS